MDGSFIQPYDIFMVVILVLATWFGAWKGMAWQLASMASFVLSFLVASRCSGLLAPYLSDHAPWNRILAMLILFVVTSAAVWILFRLVSGAINKVRLKEFDRQLGALFGMVKGVLLCLIITFFAVTLSEGVRQKVLVSRSGYYIAKLIDRTGPVLPEEVRGVLGQYIDELDRKLDPNSPAERPLSAQVQPEPALPPGQNPLGQNPPGQNPLSSELSSELGLDKVQDRVDGVQEGIEGVRRRLDGIGDDFGAVRDDLNRAGESVSRGVDQLRQRIGDMRSGGDILAEPRR